MPTARGAKEEVTDYAYRAFRRLNGENRATADYFVDVQTLAPEDHLVMQAAVQRHVDSSISKTINLPADNPFERFKDVYAQAYALGCKSCTTYRPTGDRRVLEARTGEPGRSGPAERAAPGRAAADGAISRGARKTGRCHRRGKAGGPKQRGRLHDPPLSRPGRCPGRPTRCAADQRARALHTLNDIVQDGRRRPFGDLHQLERTGALRLDGGAHANDQPPCSGAAAMCPLSSRR